MRASRAAVAALSLILAAACGGNGKIGGDDTGDGGGTGGPPDACVGLQCKIVNCNGQGIGTTRLSGTVYAPNGTLPLYNATVYVPNSDPGPLAKGVTCDRCDAALTGDPIVHTTTDELGHFALDGVPVSDNLPVVIKLGKWRRQITVSTVAQCADNPLPSTQTRMPKNASEGDLPQIAITTGGADALECLVRKLGIDDKEITTDAGAGHVHLFAGSGGTNSFNAGFGGGTGAFKDAQTLWGSLAKLKAYDIVIFSCEGAQNPGTKPAAALKAVSDFADLGGRVFLSHWHNYWLEAGPAPWPSIATFDNNSDFPSSGVASINQAFDKGKSMFKWMSGPQVKAVDAKGQLPITAPRDTAKTINNYASTGKPRAEDFVDLVSCSGCTTPSVQDFQFTTPNDAPDTDRCGKVVFSDMHVSATSKSDPTLPYPTGCDTSNALTPQEKALAFIFFVIASCVGVIVN